MQDGYSFKSENNGCSIYMSNIFYGHAPLMNGLFLLNLDLVIHIFIILMPKDAKLIMDFWNHLIMNHLILANHASWVR